MASFSHLPQVAKVGGHWWTGPAGFLPESERYSYTAQHGDLIPDAPPGRQDECFWNWDQFQKPGWMMIGWLLLESDWIGVWSEAKYRKPDWMLAGWSLIGLDWGLIGARFH